MQKDDFPGLPGASKPSALNPPRTTASIVAGIGHTDSLGSESSKYSAARPSQVEPPTIIPTQTPIRDTAPFDARAPSLGDFEFSEFSRTIPLVSPPSLSSPGPLGQSYSVGAIFGVTSLDNFSEMRHENIFGNQPALED